MDEGDLSTHLLVGDWHAFHDFGGHESQADRHDGLRVRQQREGLRIVHAGTNEELDLLWGQTTALKTHGLSVENVTPTSVCQNEFIMSFFSLSIDRISL